MLPFDHPWLWAGLGNHHDKVTAKRRSLVCDKKNLGRAHIEIPSRVPIIVLANQQALIAGSTHTNPHALNVDLPIIFFEIFSFLINRSNLQFAEMRQKRTGSLSQTSRSPDDKSYRLGGEPIGSSSERNKNGKL